MIAEDTSNQEEIRSKSENEQKVAEANRPNQF